MSVSSAVAKVKNLVVGLPPTDAEVASVAADTSALSGLVAQWMALPQYNAKMLAFLDTAFEQSEVNWGDMTPQFAAYPAPPFSQSQAEFVQDLAESFGRTALELIAEGQPFTSTLTTRRFMMTPALMAAYAAMDVAPVADGQTSTDIIPIPNGKNVTLESTTPIAPDQSVDPTSPNFLTFYWPSIATSYAPGCPSGKIVYPATSRYLSAAVLDGVAAPFMFDTSTHTLTTNFTASTLQCSPPSQAFAESRRRPPGPQPVQENVKVEVTPATPVVLPTDFTTWKMVTIRQPHLGESTTAFYNLPALRAATELVLNVPRQGFFSTLSFFGQWQTNQSNLARVTINQTLIVALGLPIDPTNMSVPRSEVALDAAHSSSGSSCYACHQSLDPMRQFFRQAYTLNYSQQTDPSQTSLPGQFAFHGVAATGVRFFDPGTLLAEHPRFAKPLLQMVASYANTGIFDLGKLLAGHPRFATAWVQKLCTYANAAPCDENDPEFLRLVGVFTSSHFSWNTLVNALFASPIVTGLSETLTLHLQGETFPIARQEHLCALLSNRLGITDVCGLEITTNVPPDLQVVQTIAGSWPSDQYGRGNPVPVLANTPSLFMRTGLENICSAVADHLIDNPTTGKFESARASAAIQSFVRGLMGLASDRRAPAMTVLQKHFASAMSAGASASDALKSTFVVACLSPYVAGIGI